jgi:hypothetical protein
MIQPAMDLIVRLCLPKLIDLCGEALAKDRFVLTVFRVERELELPAPSFRNRGDNEP